jgi:hypothetical protein
VLGSPGHKPPARFEAPAGPEQSQVDGLGAVGREAQARGIDPERLGGQVASLVQQRARSPAFGV